eukprot:COSAG01_NODE_4653_length_4846_cov_2.561197_3_plen_179_part_00
MVLPLPQGRSRCVVSLSLRLVERRGWVRRRQQDRRRLALPRELFRRARASLLLLPPSSASPDAAAAAGDAEGGPELAVSLLEQCLATLPPAQMGGRQVGSSSRSAAAAAARLLRALALTQLGQLAGVSTQQQTQPYGTHPSTLPETAYQPVAARVAASHDGHHQRPGLAVKFLSEAVV